MKRSKVFCIGFAKTGTTSLGKALSDLGYRVTGPNWVHDTFISEIIYTLVDKFVPIYDAFQDNPWPIVYEYLDKNYKGKFILTTRSSESWLKSMVNHCGTKETPFRKWVYGYSNPVGHEDVYIKRYEKHNHDVREYFKGRDDFLEMSIVNGEGYEKLCPFLGVKMINEKFPHENKTRK